MWYYNTKHLVFFQLCQILTLREYKGKKRIQKLMCYKKQLFLKSFFHFGDKDIENFKKKKTLDLYRINNEEDIVVFLFEIHYNSFLVSAAWMCKIFFWVLIEMNPFAERETGIAQQMI